MGHPFKEEIIAFEQLAAKQGRIGDNIGYRFASEAEERFYRGALNALIKSHKTDRDYSAGSSDAAKWVSMFIPYEQDLGREFGIRLSVQFNTFGNFITVELERASRRCIHGKR